MPSGYSPFDVLLIKVYVSAGSEFCIAEDQQAVQHSGWLRGAQPSFRTRSTGKDIRRLF
jgi:hypothetical protein